MPPNENALDAKSPGEVSSTSQDANQVATTTLEESSTSTDAKEKVLPFDEQAMKAVLEKHGPDEADPSKENSAASSTTEGQEKTEDSSASSGDVKKSNETEAKKEDTVDGKAKAEPVEDFSKLPFHEHPDFKRVIQTRNEARESVKQLTPLADRQKTVEDFCRTNGVTPQDFRDALEIAALRRTNPQEAARRLQPVLNELSVYQGTTLPADLQKEVDDGTITLAIAQRVAKAEANQNFVQQRSQITEAQQKEQELISSLSSWEENKKKTDPDYARKQTLVNQSFVALSAQNRWQTPDQAVALAEKAYNEVTQAILGFIPKSRPTKSLSSNGAAVSAANSQSEDFKWENAEDAMAKRYAHGVPPARRR